MTRRAKGAGPRLPLLISLFLASCDLGTPLPALAQLVSGPALNPSGSGSPGGASGQLQYNNGGAFGGFAASGDATITPSTGVIAVTKLNGVSPGNAFGTTVPSCAIPNALGWSGSAWTCNAPTPTNLAQNNQSAAYTFALTDAGQQVYHPSSDTTARTWTIPANASVAFAIGTKIDVVNDCSAGALTIAITSDTLVWFTAGSTGSRTLAACGEATLSKVGATRWVIIGSGVS